MPKHLALVFLFPSLMTIFTSYRERIKTQQMPEINPSRLVNEAENILESNTWEDRYNVPSPNLYPYQWNWDSGFVAMGFSRFDVARAIRELESLFEGQWGKRDVASYHLS